MNHLYVQYGGSVCAPAAWVNFDASPMVWFQRIPFIGMAFDQTRVRLPKNVRFGNIVKGLPIAPNSVDGLYASHVLEHLSPTECRRALANSYTILRPGGRFRLIVPDLKERTRRYLAANGADAADTFMLSLGMARERRPSGLIGRLTQLFGTSLHLWMWDEKSLTAALHAAGFRKVRRCEFSDSGDPMFEQVEDRGRFWDGDLRELALEAIK